MPLVKRPLSIALIAAIQEAHATVDYFTKTDFHRVAKKFLKRFATNHLGLKPSDFDVTSLWGGDAVAGEIVLHTDTVYIKICAEMSSPVLIRECVGRRDYVGGPNEWTDVNGLLRGHHILKTNYPAQYDKGWFNSALPANTI